MSPPQSVSGQCLCGWVKVRVGTASNEVDACHCSMCRRWTAGPFMAVDCKQQVDFDGQEQVRVYDSSEWAERGFAVIAACIFFTV